MPVTSSSARTRSAAVYSRTAGGRQAAVEPVERAGVGHRFHHRAGDRGPPHEVEHRGERTTGAPRQDRADLLLGDPVHVPQPHPDPEPLSSGSGILLGGGAAASLLGRSQRAKRSSVRALPPRVFRRASSSLARARLRSRSPASEAPSPLLTFVIDRWMRGARFGGG